MGGVMNAKLLSLLLVPGVCLAEGVWAQEEEDGGEIPAVGVSRPVVLVEGSPRSWVGTVKAAETVSVTARVTGEILRRKFAEGASVEKGQTRDGPLWPPFCASSPVCPLAAHPLCSLCSLWLPLFSARRNGSPHHGADGAAPLFPGMGFSTVWKTGLHCVEKWPKPASIAWKIFQNTFPLCGKPRKHASIMWNFLRRNGKR